MLDLKGNLGLWVTRDLGEHWVHRVTQEQIPRDHQEIPVIPDHLDLLVHQGK